MSRSGHMGKFHRLVLCVGLIRSQIACYFLLFKFSCEAFEKDIFITF